MLFTKIWYGALGNVGALAMTFAILFFSIPPAIGEMIVIVSAAVCVSVDPTITVFLPTIVSLMMSDTLIVKVHDFFMDNLLENSFTPWSSGKNVYKPSLGTV